MSLIQTDLYRFTHIWKDSYRLVQIHILAGKFCVVLTIIIEGCRLNNQAYVLSFDCTRFRNIANKAFSSDLSKLVKSNDVTSEPSNLNICYHKNKLITSTKSISVTILQ